MTKQKKLNHIFSGDHWKFNACLNFSHDMGYGYVEGYKKAAEILISYIETKMNDQDILVYPIVFMYRHYLELLLKEIIKNGSKILNLEFDNNDYHHEILKLWNKVKSIILKIDTNCKEDINMVEKVIVKINKINKQDRS
jgi:hypothetical protein